MLDHPWKSWSKNEKHHLKTTLQSNVKVDLALSVLLGNCHDIYNTRGDHI